MTSASERRTAPRAPLDILVQFQVENMETFIKDFASNISTAGMFIRSTEPKDVGAVIALQFRLDNGGRLIEGVGKVVHVNPPDSEHPGMGVEFINLDDDSRKLIEQLVESAPERV